MKSFTDSTDNMCCQEGIGKWIELVYVDQQAKSQNQDRDSRRGCKRGQLREIKEARFFPPLNQ